MLSVPIKELPVHALFDFLDDFVYGPLNYIDRIEGLFRAVWYQDLGYRFTMPRIDKGGNHNLRQVEDLLGRYGIAVYCRTYNANYRYFRVKKRQARWAEYLMLHAGVELYGSLFDPRNARYVSQHPPGWMPKPWSAPHEDDPGDTEIVATSPEDEIADHSDGDNGWRALKKLVDW